MTQQVNEERNKIQGLQTEYDNYIQTQQDKETELNEKIQQLENNNKKLKENYKELENTQQTTEQNKTVEINYLKEQLEQQKATVTDLQ